jgi:hypothetical protein
MAQDSGHFIRKTRRRPPRRTGSAGRNKEPRVARIAKSLALARPTLTACAVA